MYRDEILDHYRKPRNEGRIENSISAEGENASCGDETEIFLKTEENKLKEMKHETEACAICTASISIISEEFKGKDVDEINSLGKDWIIDRLGIDISPMRMKCALLGLETVQKALEKQR